MNEACKAKPMINYEAIALGRGRPVSESRLVILEPRRLKSWNTWEAITLGTYMPSGRPMKRSPATSPSEPPSKA